MSLTRRIFLAGGAGALVLATGATTFALTRTPVDALAPWQTIRSPSADPRRFIVEHAVLAPNPHNRQPWLVEMLPDGNMMLFCDLERRLPETDPFDRQIVIGLGCFVELAAIAAAQLGYRLDVTTFPDGGGLPRLDARPVAHLAVVKDPNLAPDPLFVRIPERRSIKQPFDLSRPLSERDIAKLVLAARPGVTVDVVSASPTVGAVRNLTWDAWQVEAATSRTHLESVRLMRIGRREIEANPDGIAIGGPMLEALAVAGVLSREELAKPGSAAMKQGEARYRTMLAATGAYLVVKAADAGRVGEFEAGRAYLRANLVATAVGLAMHPVSQALQEFPEMADIHLRMNAALGITAPARLHMLARLGYGPATAPTPRWAAATRIVQNGRPTA